MSQPILPPTAAVPSSATHGHVRLRRRATGADGGAPGEAHTHDHTHDHAHGHDHAHDHGHDHSHGHAAGPVHVSARPAPSLIRASLGVRLALAGVLSGLIWAGVLWARLPIAG